MEYPERLRSGLEKLGYTCDDTGIHIGDRYLKGMWSPVAPQVIEDLKRFHGLDAEEELINMFIQEAELTKLCADGMDFEAALAKVFGDKLATALSHGNK